MKHLPLAIVVGAVGWLAASPANAQESEPPPADGTATSPDESPPDGEPPPAGDAESAADVVDPSTVIGKKRPSKGLTLQEMVSGLDHTGTPSKPKRGGELPAQSAEPGEERPMPNYDNRADPPMDATDVMIWIPRILFYPVHLLFEWGIRWPLVELATFVERYKVIERFNDLITWDEGRAGFFPRFFTDFGVRPHAGISFFWNELADDNDIGASVSLWGDDLLAIRAGSTHRLFDHGTAELTMHANYVRRPDNPYYGKDDPTDRCRAVNGCRYRTAEISADASLRAFFDGLNRFTATLSYRNMEFSNDSDNPRLTATEAAGLPGFSEGYNLLDLAFKGEIDTRHPDIMFEPDSGIRVELDGAFALDPINPDVRFIRYGGEASGFWDFGHRHVIAARLYVQMLENVGEKYDSTRQRRTPIPFSEKLTLGGAEHMRGFLEGNLRGRHAWTATVEYRYPIYALLDTSLFVSMGNAFRDFSDFDVARNYLSYGFAFRTNASRDIALQILIALGSNRLDSSSFKPADTFRFAFGITHGF